MVKIVLLLYIKNNFACKVLSNHCSVCYIHISAVTYILFQIILNSVHIGLAFPCHSGCDVMKDEKKYSTHWSPGNSICISEC